MDLFGSPPSVSYTNPITTLPDYLQNYLQTASTFLTGQVGLPAVPYTGPLAAGLSAQQIQALNEISAQSATAQGTIPTGVGTLTGIATGAISGEDPTLANAIAAIKAQAASMGGGTSSGLLNAEALTTADINAAEVGNRLQAASALLNYPTQSSEALMAAGQVPQQTEQTLFGLSYQDFLRQIQQMWQSAGLGIQNIGQYSYANPVTYNPPPILGLLQGAASYYLPKWAGA